MEPTLPARNPVCCIHYRAHEVSFRDKAKLGAEIILLQLLTEGICSFFPIALVSSKDNGNLPPSLLPFSPLRGD